MGIKYVKVQLYNKTRTKAQILNKFGDYILDSICISCTIKENLSTTEYFLDAEFYVDNEGLYKCIEEDAVLKVKTDYGDEIFSIVNIKKTPSRIIVFARQITITESLCTWLTDVRPENKNGQDALNHMGNNGTGLHNLEFESDIDKTNTGFYLNKTLYDALHISDNCFAIRWGGEVKRRGYKLTFNKSLGEDRGVQIRSGKNLVGFEADTNIDNIITRIKPIGFNGVTINGYVDSPLINKYKYIRTQTMKYEHVKLRSDLGEDGTSEEGDLVFDTLAEVQEKLTELALLEFLDSIDIIKAEYVINFVDLSTTEEYKNYTQAENITIGDIVHVYESKHNINIAVRAIERKYDVLGQRVIEITLSNNAISEERSTTIEQLKSRLDDVLEDIGYMRVNYATVGSLDAVNAKIDSLDVNKATVGELSATNLIVEYLQANKVDIKELDDANARIDDLEKNKADKSALTSINKDIQDLKGKIPNETVIQGINEEIELLKDTKANASDLEGIETSISNLRTSKANQSDLLYVSGQVDTNKSSINDLTTNINDLTTNYDSLIKTIESLQETIKSLEERIQVLETPETPPDDGEEN